MKPYLDRADRLAPVWLGVITLGSVCVLLVRDIRPKLFPVRAHDVLGRVPVALSCEGGKSGTLRMYFIGILEPV